MISAVYAMLLNSQKKRPTHRTYKEYESTFLFITSWRAKNTALFEGTQTPPTYVFDKE
jgi:menaquinone-dependent protoporphyrinogen IX oxidase